MRMFLGALEKLRPVTFSSIGEIQPLWFDHLGPQGKVIARTCFRDHGATGSPTPENLPPPYPLRRG